MIVLLCIHISSRSQGGDPPPNLPPKELWLVIDVWFEEECPLFPMTTIKNFSLLRAIVLHLWEGNKWGKMGPDAKLIFKLFVVFLFLFFFNVSVKYGISIKSPIPISWTTELWDISESIHISHCLLHAINGMSTCVWFLLKTQTWFLCVCVIGVKWR